MRRLSITFGDNTVELPPGESILGRDLSCQVRFADLRVSRQHLRIRLCADGATVEDLGSSNGTSLNGVALVGVRPLVHGDQLELGGTTMLRVGVGAARPQRHVAETLEPDTLLVHASEIVAMAVPTAEFARVHSVATDVDREDAVSAVRARQRTNAERRRHARAAAAVPVSYDSDTLNIDAFARDLSDGGVFVVSELLDQVGTACSMMIELDGSRPFRASGVVRHVVLNDATSPHPPGMGIQFTDLRALGSQA